ncbi:MAG: hypothetical protein R3F48_09130 [Candidatus Zixiibacteriota bacterium]
MAMSKGCTIALIIVGAILILLVIGIGLLWMNKDKIVEAGIDFMVDNVGTEIKANLPEGYTVEYVDELLTEFKTKLKDGSMTPDEIQRMGETLKTAMDDEKLDSEEAKKLLLLIEQKLGKEVMPPMEEEMPDSAEPEPAGAH